CGTLRARAAPAVGSLSLHDALPIFGHELVQHVERLHGDGEPDTGLEVGGQEPRVAGLAANDAVVAAEEEATASFAARPATRGSRSEEHTSELQSRVDLVCRLLLEKK